MDHLRADARLLAAADQASSAADQTLSDTAQTPRALGGLYRPDASPRSAAHEFVLGSFADD